MPRATANQRRAQVHEAGQNIARESRRLADELGISQHDAERLVFGDPVLLARCHEVAPVSDYPEKWTEPEE